MKQKLASLALLTLAPMAAHAELAGVAGQGITFNFNFMFDEVISGINVYKNVCA